MVRTLSNKIYFLFFRFRFLKSHKVLGWFSQIFSLDGAGAPADAREWSRSDWASCVFCLQGRRENNEDRAAIETVSMVEGADTGAEVNIWAVMDGHGGQVTGGRDSGHRGRDNADLFSVLCRLQHQAFYSKPQEIHSNVKAFNKFIKQ